MPDGLEGQILEMLLLAIMLCSILIGSNRGLFLSLYSTIKYLLVVVATVAISPVIVRRLPESVDVKEGIGYLIALIISMILFGIIGRLFKLINDIPIIGGINKLGGAFFGLLCGFMVVWTALTLLGVMQEYSWCEELVKSARDNDVVMWFQQCNPVPVILERFDFPII